MIPLSFHHVGVGTAEFAQAIQIYTQLGHRLFKSVDDPLLNVRVAFLSCPYRSGPWIEILAPLGEGGPLHALTKRKLLPSPYHTCYAVSALEPALADLQDAGFFQLGDPKRAIAFDLARVAFLHHPAIGLVELVENPPSWPVPDGG